MWLGVGNELLITRKKTKNRSFSFSSSSRTGNVDIGAALKNRKQWRGRRTQRKGGSQGERTDAGIRVDDELVAADLLAVLPHPESGQRLRSLGLERTRIAAQKEVPPNSESESWKAGRRGRGRRGDGRWGWDATSLFSLSPPSYCFLVSRILPFGFAFSNPPGHAFGLPVLCVAVFIDGDGDGEMRHGGDESSSSQ